MKKTNEERAREKTLRLSVSYGWGPEGLEARVNACEVMDAYLGDEHTFTIDVPAGEARFVSVYRPQPSINPEWPDKHGLSVPSALVPKRLLPFVHVNETHDLVTMRSNWAPEVRVLTVVPGRTIDRWHREPDQEVLDDRGGLEWLSHKIDVQAVKNLTPDAFLATQALRLEVVAKRAGSIPNYPRYGVPADRRFLSLRTVTVVRP